MVKQCNQVVFEHGLQLGVLVVLAVTDLQGLTDLVLRNILSEFDPAVNGHIGEFDCVDLIRFDLSYRVSVVIVCQNRIDYGNKYSRFMEILRDGFIVTPCIFHKHTGLTGKAFQKPCQFFEFTLGVAYLKGGGYYLAEGAHDGNHALSFGHVNSYCIHFCSPAFKFAEMVPPFTHCLFNLFGDADVCSSPTCLNRTLQ